MRIRPEQLESAVSNKPLLPVYIITGDEPLQMKEATDAVRRSAREQGYEERVVLDVGSGFDWNSLLAQNDMMSLFGSRKLIELRLGSSKPGAAGGKVLQAYVANLCEDNLLLISCDKVDKRSQQTKWFKSLEQVGGVVQIWPVDSKAMPGWIAFRAQNMGLTLEQEACALLADRVEGNLLAAQQELELLRLLLGDQAGDAKAVAAAVSDSARFDVFTLVDEILSGHSARVTRMLKGLREEGTEPVIINWALSRELRSLCAMAAACDSGQSVDAVMQSFRIWNNRKQPISSILGRYNVRALRKLLELSGRCERIIKGSIKGDPWQALNWLVLGMSGVRLPISKYIP